MFKWLVILLLVPSAAQASIGKVAVAEGSGIIKRDSVDIIGTQGADLVMLDTIKTANGLMQLEFVDDTRVDVTAHSRMVIDEFVYDPDAGNGALGMRATLGAVRYASGSIAKNNRRNVNISTPSATIGVRGTDFMMIVDELGGSMITLLPSCNSQGMCVVGEISVETDEGMVIMNQAFQTTLTSTRNSMPAKPRILELPENMLTSMLIVRKTSPYDEQAQKAFPVTDILDIDFLAFDELDRDPLIESIKNIWVTDLDNDGYLNEMFVDELSNLMKKIIADLLSELDAQNAAFFEQKIRGIDPVTGIFYDEEPPNNILKRNENTHVIDLTLSQSHGYTLDIIQNSFSIYGYRIGVGSNKIYINQQE